MYIAPSAAHMVPTSASDFEFQDIIDTGALSSIVLVRDKKRGEKYAAKIVSKRLLCRDLQLAQAASREKDVLLLCRDRKIPGIVNIFSTFQDSLNLYYILQYCENGNIKNYWQQTNDIPLNLKVKWLMDLCLSVAGLHDLNILHGDLKPENCLLDSSLNVTLCDFNSAQTLEDKTAVVRTKMGSAPYLSPEAISSNERGLPSDVWAIGCIAYELLTHHMAFCGATDYLTMQLIGQHSFEWRAPLREPDPHLPESLTDGAVCHTLEEVYSIASDFVAKCLDRDVLKRITAREACSHPLFGCILTE